MSVDRNKILDRIKALRAKTVDNGCTEEEALAAAQKVAALLEKYSLTLTDEELGAADCVKGRAEEEEVYNHPLSACLTGIAYFTDTEAWFEVSTNPDLPRNDAKRQRPVFFGLPQDVDVAVYLYALLKRALIAEGAAYENRIRFFRAAVRRGKVRDFQLGMADRLKERLHEMKDALRADTRRDTGRDLVVVKGAIVQREYDALGLKLRKSRCSRRAVDAAAFFDGIDAAEGVSIIPGVRGGADAVMMIGGA